LYVLSREIGRDMPTIEIQGAGLIGEIKNIKWRYNCLNGKPIQNGVTFVLKSERNGH
jgi:hypothetical protein